MKKMFACGLVLMLVIGACHKPNDERPPSPQPSLSDARTVLLKKVLIDGLPPPYFEFMYDGSNFVTHIDFASKLVQWDVKYENKRVSKMIDFVSKDSLVYTYSSNRVSMIRHYSTFRNRVTWCYEFEYDNRGRMTESRWWAFPVSANDSLLHRKIIYTYQPDDNLAKYEYYTYNETTNQFGWVYTTEFSNYDQGTNVNDFYLAKSFFDDVLFLPQVKWQKNNPRKAVTKGVINDYVFDYSYQYNTANLPLVATYDMLQTRGSDTGKPFKGRTEFTY